MTYFTRDIVGNRLMSEWDDRGIYLHHDMDMLSANMTCPGTHFIIKFKLIQYKRIPWSQHHSSAKPQLNLWHGHAICPTACMNMVTYPNNNYRYSSVENRPRFVSNYCVSPTTRDLVPSNIDEHNYDRCRGISALRHTYIIFIASY